MWRKILGVVAGLVVAVVVIAVIEGISTVIYPPPADLDFNDAEAMSAYVRQLPLGAKLLVLLAHGVGTFLAGVVCGLVVGQRWLVGAVIISGLFLLTGVLNLMMIPHPVWFALVDVPVLGLGAVAGMLAASAMRRPAAVAAQG